VYLALTFLRRLFCLLPHRAAAALAGWLGRIWYVVDAPHRRVAKSNLVNAFPEWRHRRVCRTARAVFEHLARSIVEFLREPLYADPAYLARRVRVVGEDRMRAALDQGRGVVLLLAHWGNWEIGGLVCNALGYPHSAVGRAFRSKGAMRFLNETRARAGTRFIDKHEAVRPVLGALRAGESVGFFVDQTTSEEGMATTFFGRMCETTRGPVGFALKTGAPVVPIMCPLLADGRYEVRFYEPIAHPHTGDFRRDVDELTQRLTSFIEARVRERPEQWLWMHRRWKPPGGGRLPRGFRHVETILVTAPDEADRLEAARAVFAHLKSVYPHSRLAVLVEAPSGAALDGDSHVDEVIEYTHHAGPRGWLEAARTIRRLRRRYFHMAVLLSGSSRSALWAALAGIPIRVGTKGQRGHRLLTHRAVPHAP
jgi:KDO2-lipid IV(A) lauroyltransferase